VTAFTETTPTLENFWRSIILFGRNVASYKFALGKSLLELADQDSDAVSLGELAVPFARHPCEHLQLADKQGTFGQSRFLDACRAYNLGELTQDQLVEQTARLGFNNVIDAFHVVNQGEVPVRFFTDERRQSGKGIRLPMNCARSALTSSTATCPSSLRRGGGGQRDLELDGITGLREVSHRGGGTVRVYEGGLRLRPGNRGREPHPAGDVRLGAPGHPGARREALRP
jgi:hypothetical protein